jgi:hypothetical protein
MTVKQNNSSENQGTCSRRLKEESLLDNILRCPELDNRPTLYRTGCVYATRSPAPRDTQDAVPNGMILTPSSSLSNTER